TAPAPRAALSSAQIGAGQWRTDLGSTTAYPCCPSPFARGPSRPHGDDQSKARKARAKIVPVTISVDGFLGVLLLTKDSSQRQCRLLTHTRPLRARSRTRARCRGPPVECHERKHRQRLVTQPVAAHDRS